MGNAFGVWVGQVGSHRNDRGVMIFGFEQSLIESTARLRLDPASGVLDGGSIAILGADMPGLRPDMAVTQGARVVSGQVLFTDRRFEGLACVAAATGTVTEITFGARRSLSALVIRPEPGADDKVVANCPGATGAEVRAALVQRGLWPSFLARPFGRVPDPKASPDAIFVTAIDTNPLAADPATVLAMRGEAFNRGLRTLTKLTAGPVFVCCAPGLNPVEDRVENVETVHFSGEHPSGLTGTHIGRLWPITLARHEAGRAVWTVGYQDVIAMGHLFQTGEYLDERVVTLSGPMVDRPQLIRARLGADIGGIAARFGIPSGYRGISGSVLTGRVATHLGRYHTQITVLPGTVHPRWPLAARIARWIGARRPVIAIDGLDGAVTGAIPALPLMRALSVGDAMAARDLGALALLEEDVAMLSATCTSGADYGALLRRVLDELEQAA